MMPARAQVVSSLMTTTTTSAMAAHSAGNDSGSHSATPSASSPVAPHSSGPRRSTRHVAFCLDDESNSNDGGTDSRAATAAVAHSPPSDSTQSTSALPSSSWCSRAETEALRELALERGVDFARVASELGFEVVTTVATMSQHGQRRSATGAPPGDDGEDKGPAVRTLKSDVEEAIDGGREGGERVGAAVDPLSEPVDTIENCSVHIHGTKQPPSEQRTGLGTTGRQISGEGDTAAAVQRRLSAHSKPRTTNQSGAGAVRMAPVSSPPLPLNPPTYLYPAVTSGVGVAQDDWLPRDWHRGRSGSSATSSSHASPTEECGPVPILTPPLLFTHSPQQQQQPGQQRSASQRDDGSRPSTHDTSHEDSPHADTRYYTSCPSALRLSTLSLAQRDDDDDAHHHSQPPQRSGLPAVALGSTVSLATNATLNLNSAVPLSPDRPQDASVSESLSIPVPSTEGHGAIAVTNVNQSLLLPSPLVTMAGRPHRTRQQVNAPPTRAQLTPHERMPLPLSTHSTPRLVELGSTDTSPDNLSPRRWAEPPSPPTRRLVAGRQHVSRLSSRGGRAAGALSSSNNSSTHTIPLAPNAAHMNAFSSGRSNASTSAGSTAWADRTDGLEMPSAPWAPWPTTTTTTTAAPASLQLRRRGEMLNARSQLYDDGLQPADIH